MMRADKQQGEKIGLMIDVKKIHPSPYQPRKQIDEEKLQELKQSIEAFGVLEPILVRTIPLLDEKESPDFQIIAGHRRLMAAKLAGLDFVPAIVKDLTDEEAQEIAYIENLQREDLNIVEEAETLKKLYDLYSQEEYLLAKKIGKSVGYVRDRLAVMSLPEPVQAMLVNKQLNLSCAKIIAEIDIPEDQIMAAQYAEKMQLTAQRLKGHILHMIKPKKKRFTNSPSTTRINANLIRLYNDLKQLNLDILDQPQRELLFHQIKPLEKTLGEILNRLCCML